ncbi:hypothetical protein GHK33_04520 [Sinorhizobium meliloti]|uniref:hypothetical protein n=2 Tax=Rhizobium meliloti TaxID=382 RepID=UPI000FD5848F|nr:hypothetical protein [Sinorhizobium meliloti]WQO70623.1 hypothetical protein U8C40_39415 [Sinorhizobium medicae]MDW9682829.1 hypothetical protein [Sinorhizobium meliloti]MDW9693979.1 hypothetical protein [Sinorhizobium meliloti]MDW9718921.1 hypothetical protein [Sinorhizobium meliloti]MDW9756117.1 hypothetical protein [Sinorhizobium meliloti]
MEVSLKDFQRQVRALELLVAGGGAGLPERVETLKTFDPYPDVPSALLNAGHLATYGIVAGMIQPFDVTRLEKPATYLVAAKGPCRYRDEQGNIERFVLSNDPNDRDNEIEEVRDHVRIAPNSVCFVTLEPEFHMPAYIGARFNLMIRDVYRGLLVGTGPLVDPGFSGRLSIPIHNFTTREYFIRAGEGLVYFEFTKLSWVNDPLQAPPVWLPARIDNQPPFPGSKNRRKNIDHYLDEATGGGPPQNAIGDEIAKLRKYADDAKRLLRIYSVAGVAAAVSLLYSGWSLYSAAQQFVQSAQTEMRERAESADDAITELRNNLTEAQKRIAQLEKVPQPAPRR